MTQLCIFFWLPFSVTLIINSYIRVNWLNKEEHKFTIPDKFKDITTSDKEFESHFGMEHCLIHAKDIISEQEFVYYTKQESATGSF